MGINKKIQIAIVGLGYVGLPLAVEFAKKFNVIGFDINTKRIQELDKGIDFTREVEPDELKQSNLQYSDQIATLSDCNVFIITVPTPEAYDLCKKSRSSI